MPIAETAPNIGLITGQDANQASYYSAHANLAGAQTADVQAQTELRKQQALQDQQGLQQEQAEQLQVGQLAKASMRPDGTMDYSGFTKKVAGLPISMKARVEAQQAFKGQAQAQIIAELSQKYGVGTPQFYDAVAQNPDAGPDVALKLQGIAEHTAEIQETTRAKVDNQYQQSAVDTVKSLRAIGASSDDILTALAAIHTTSGYGDLFKHMPPLASEQSRLAFIDRAVQSMETPEEQQAETSAAKEQAAQVNEQRQREQEDKRIAIEQERADTEKAQHSVERIKAIAELKADAGDKKEWATATDEATLKGRGANKMTQTAQQTLMNTKRALRILGKDTVTSQNIATVIGDIAQTTTGKGATDFSMKEQDYGSLQRSIANAMQFISGHPTSALPDGIKKDLQATLADFKDQNEQILKAHLDNVEDKHPVVISDKYKDQWQRIRERVMNSGGEAVQSSSGNLKDGLRTGKSENAPDHAAALNWAKAHPDDPRAKKIFQINGVSQ